MENGTSPNAYLCFPAFSISASPHAVSFQCRISTGLPMGKFMVLSAHIHMALQWIWCSNSDWTSTFQSVYEWCCSPMSELEHYGFWATVLFLQNLCWIKKIYHLGKKEEIPALRHLSRVSLGFRAVFSYLRCRFTVPNHCSGDKQRSG